MNYANLAQKTNFIAGSSAFDKIPFFLTDVNLPGLTLNHTEIGGRHSGRINMSADTFAWNSLSLELLIDEDFEIYKEIIEIIRQNIDIETGTFKDFTFPFWVEISNSKGNPLFKVEYSNCRIMSVGDIMFSTQDEATEHTLTLDIVYDSYIIENDLEKLNKLESLDPELFS